MKKIIFVLLFNNFVFSQVNQQWVARYNGPNNSGDIASACVVDANSNVYVTGGSSGSASSCFTTIKYNTNGVQQWLAVYSGPGNGNNIANAICLDSSGNVFVTGESEGIGTGGDIVTIKYNSNGSQQWAARYIGAGGYSSAFSTNIMVDASGNIYVTGASVQANTDFVTIKYNTSGAQQWVAFYNGPQNSEDLAYSIAIDGPGNIYVAGKCWLNYQFCEYAVVKYNNNGIQRWVARHSGCDNNSNAGCKVVTDAGGNVFFAASIFKVSSALDYLTIKYNANGVQQWEATYNGSANNLDEATSMAIDPNGNVYVTGYSEEINSGTDCVTIKYSSAGVQQWVRNYEGLVNNNDRGSRITTDGSGSAYVTGYCWGGSETGHDYLTLKYNSAGVQQWVKTYNGPGNNTDLSRSIALDRTGNVFVTGWSSGTLSESDFATIKYSQLVEINPIGSQIPNKYNLYQNYPNPFNPVTKIKFDVSPLYERGAKGGFVTLMVFDILGREVAVLVNQQLQPGTYEVNWDATGGASEFTSGVYFYKLITQDASAPLSITKKMVLIK